VRRGREGGFGVWGLRFVDHGVGFCREGLAGMGLKKRKGMRLEGGLDR
jgi:hypothetical protein